MKVVIHVRALLLSFRSQAFVVFALLAATATNVVGDAGFLSGAALEAV
jgi:hypothetical protein